MSNMSELAIEYEEKSLKTDLLKDANMIKLALNLALRNSTILFHNIEKNRGYNLDCEKLDNIEQKIQNLLDEIQGLKL